MAQTEIKIKINVSDGIKKLRNFERKNDLFQMRYSILLFKKSLISYIKHLSLWHKQ